MRASLVEAGAAAAKTKEKEMSEVRSGRRSRPKCEPRPVSSLRPGLAVASLVSWVFLAGLASTLALEALADVPVEEIGRVVAMPASPDKHWAMISDPVLERTALVDLDSGNMLGVIDGGWGITTPYVSSNGREIYVPETHYSRRSRGERTDVVTFYDLATLLPTGEVVIPPKRAINALPVANAAVSDDGGFLAVFNMNPATSLSIVDVSARRFAGEIATPGCSLVYPAGNRRFAMLCLDGAMLLVTLDEAGQLLSRERSEPFFDAQKDPVTEKAARNGDTWLFVSFEGWVHPVDLSGDAPRFGERWSLLGERDRADSWRIGGSQHLAVHRGSGRLFSLVHQGGKDTHKSGGTELWVYDLSTRERVQRIELRNPGLTYLGVPLEFGQSWVWPFSGLYDGLLGLAGDLLAVEEVIVTQGEEPLLITGSNYSGSLALYDAMSGEFLRRVVTGNMVTFGLQAPWGGGR